MNTNINRFSHKQYWAGSDCEVNFTIVKSFIHLK